MGQDQLTALRRELAEAKRVLLAAITVYEGANTQANLNQIARAMIAHDQLFDRVKNHQRRASTSTTTRSKERRS